MKNLIPLLAIGAGAYWWMNRKPKQVPVTTVDPVAGLAAHGVNPYVAQAAIAGMTPMEKERAMTDRVFLAQLAEEIKGSVAV